MNLPYVSASLHASADMAALPCHLHVLMYCDGEPLAYVTAVVLIGQL